MCNKCHSLRREIAADRLLLADLTDPVSIGFAKADIRALEEKLTRAIAEHPAGK
jgi:hypothetical protein